MSAKTVHTISQQTLEAFRQGREMAFDCIFKAFFPALTFYALGFTGDQSASEDLAEEAFLKIWAKREQFHDPAKLKSYLYAIVRNSAITWRRLNRRREEIVSREMPLPDPESELSALESMIRAEMLRELYMAIDTLPDQCRRVMKLIYLEGKNVREVAEELQLSIGTVKTHKARGLSLLKGRLPGAPLILALLFFDSLSTF